MPALRSIMQRWCSLKQQRCRVVRHLSVLHCNSAQILEKRNSSTVAASKGAFFRPGAITLQSSCRTLIESRGFAASAAGEDGSVAKTEAALEEKLRAALSPTRVKVTDTSGLLLFQTFLKSYSNWFFKTWIEGACLPNKSNRFLEPLKISMPGLNSHDLQIASQNVETIVEVQVCMVSWTLPGVHHHKDGGVRSLSQLTIAFILYIPCMLVESLFSKPRS
jgi:hypothetical protein